MEFEHDTFILCAKDELVKMQTLDADKGYMAFCVLGSFLHAADISSDDAVAKALGLTWLEFDDLKNDVCTGFARNQLMKISEDPDMPPDDALELFSDIRKALKMIRLHPDMDAYYEALGVSREWYADLQAGAGIRMAQNMLAVALDPDTHPNTRGILLLQFKGALHRGGLDDEADSTYERMGVNRDWINRAKGQVLSI